MASGRIIYLALWKVSIYFKSNQEMYAAFELKLAIETLLNLNRPRTGNVAGEMWPLTSNRGFVFDCFN